MLSAPCTELQVPRRVRKSPASTQPSLRTFVRAGTRAPRAKLDLPDPDTPAMHVTVPRGMRTDASWTL